MMPATRNFVGYGQRPPKVGWPGGARLAVSVVVNYEEGSEHSSLDGDPRGESLGESAPSAPLVRDVANETMFEYGSRAGVWRLLRILARHDVHATFFACALAVERNPAVGRAAVAAGHEICSHGYRWEEHYLMDRETERERIRLAVESLARTTGQRPLGWYCRYGPSPVTRELVVEEGGFVYDSDSYGDDLPYYVEVNGKPWLVVPYALDTNDTRFWRGGFHTADQFYTYLRDALDCLYEEGAEAPRMMSVGLHCRIAGRPGRAPGLDRFLAYARSRPGVWFARRIDIARWWLEHARP